MAMFAVFFELIWFIVIFLIIFSVIKATKTTSNTIKRNFTTMDDINKIIKEKTDYIRNQNFKYSNNNKKDSRNSYYDKEKVNSYKKQEENHTTHFENDDIDLTKSIGYKKCPKCENMISVKSDECFMCGYKFED